MHLRPLHDNILVTPLEAKEKTEGGLFIPENAKEKPTRGKVVAVGEGRTDEHGKRVPLDVKVGDEVLYGKYAGTDVELHGEQHKMIKEADVLAVVEGEGADAKG